MMNKQELIRRLKAAITEPALNDYQRVENIALTYALGLVEELEKPVVPQYVADWYEEHKDDFEYSIRCLCVHGCLPKRKIDTWFDSSDNKPIETLVKMKLFGYEVEKEKQYVVVIPDDGRNGFIQLWKNREGKLLFNFEDKIRYGKVHLLTEKEIKQKDKRLWQFAKEVNNNDD